MNINEMRHVHVQSSHPRRKIRPVSRPNMVAAFLGVVCVAGVFGMLGLLYSLG